MIEPVKPKRVFFATDFSIYSERARDWALGIAKMAEASIVVLHVIDFVDTSSDVHLQNWFERLKNDAATRLETEVELFRNSGVEAYGELAIGDPSETIVEKTTLMDADLIVIGSHGLRTREGRLLLGTTSHRIALGANLPVLIVKADKDTSGSPSD